MRETVYNKHDEEDWSSCDHDVNAVIREYLEELENEELSEIGDTLILYKGEQNDHTFGDFFCVDTMLDNIRENSYNNHGEFSETFLDNVTKEQTEELEKLVLDWADKNDLHPTFYSIKNIEEVTVEINKDMVEAEALKRIVQMSQEDYRQGRTRPMSEFIEELKERRRALGEG